MEDFGEKMTDERWTLNDKLVQLKGIIDLHERSRKWLKVRTKLIRKEQKKEVRELSKNTKQARGLILSFKNGDRGALQRILQDDRELRILCKDQPTEVVEENVKQIIFSRRKEFDRIKSELDKKQELYFQCKLVIEEVKQFTEKKPEIPPTITRGQEVATKIERVLLQKEAARIVQDSYDKMRRILQKDARCFDAVLAGLRLDTLVQCQCVLRAMELGQIATEDVARFREQYLEEFKKSKETMEKRTNFIKDLKRRVAKVRETNSKVARYDSYSKFPTDGPETNEYIRTLAMNQKNLKNNLQKLEETALVTTPDEIFGRAEDIMKQKYRLLRQLEINTIWRDTELMRRNHMEKMLEDLQHSEVETTKQFRLDRERLQQEINDKKELYKQYERDIVHDGHHVLKIRANMMHFVQLLSRITLDNPSEPGEEVVKVDLGDIYQPTATMAALPSEVTELKEEDEASEISMESDSDDSTEPNEPDIDVNHLFDVLNLKLNMIMKQLKVGHLNSEEEEAARRNYTLSIMEEQDFVEEEGPKRLATGVLDEFAKQARCKILTRKDLKAASRQIVEANEVKPTYTEGVSKIVKHDCY